jgi:AraC-like DNA-binding protein
MPGSGTRTFIDSDLYETSLRQAHIEMSITSLGEFKACLTCVELHDLQLLRREEDLPRIAYLSLMPRLDFVSFPGGTGPSPVWAGREMQATDIMLHGRGERLHQRTRGPATWSAIALRPEALEGFSGTLAGISISAPPEGLVLRPASRDAARLQRLHARACRLAERQAKMLAHPQVARAIEQSLVQALVTCLTDASEVHDNGPARRHHAKIMRKFEEVLAVHISRPLRIPDLCELVGVTERTLRSCCAEFLGISAGRYVLLRRLKQVRRALRDADARMTNVIELARQHGFTELARFAGAYQAAFGEAPSTTLRRVRETRFVGP